MVMSMPLLFSWIHMGNLFIFIVIQFLKIVLSLKIMSLLPIRVFLYQTARNKCLDLLKHEQVVHKHEAALIQELSEDSLDEKMIEEEVLGEIYRAIDELPPECRRVFRLGLEGLSNQEIADSLSISINTVRTQKQRAMIVLKKRFSMGTLLVLFGMVDLFN